MKEEQGMANSEKKELRIHIIVVFALGSERSFDFHKREVTAHDIKEVAHLPPEVGLEVIRDDGKRYLLESREPICIKDGERFFVVRHERHIHYTVDGIAQLTWEPELTPVQIMEHADIDPSDHYLAEVIGEREESFKETPTKPIRMRNHMKFVTKTVFTIYVDGTRFEVTSSSMTGAQIKATAGKDVQYQLFLEQGANEPDKLIGDNDPVQIKNGMKFYTVPPATFGA